MPELLRGAAISERHGGVKPHPTARCRVGFYPTVAHDNPCQKVNENHQPLMNTRKNAMSRKMTQPPHRPKTAVTGASVTVAARPSIVHSNMAATVDSLVSPITTTAPSCAALNAARSR